MIVYSNKSYFTKAGLILYSRRKKSLPETTQKALLATLVRLKALDMEAQAELKQQVESLFEVERD